MKNRILLVAGSLLILAVLGALGVVWVYTSARAGYRSEQAANTVGGLRRLTMYSWRYRIIYGHFPGCGVPGGRGLGQKEWTQALTEALRCAPDDPIFFDAWGNRFQYVCPGKRNTHWFDIYSAGVNGRDEGGNGDDVGNWIGSHNKYDGLSKYDGLWEGIEQYWKEIERDAAHQDFPGRTGPSASD